MLAAESQAAVEEPLPQAAVEEPSRLVVGEILQQHLSYLLDQCSCAHCGRIYTHGLRKHEQACQHRHTDRAQEASRLDLEAEAEGETEAEAEGETEVEVGTEAETESTTESADSEFQSHAPGGAAYEATGAETEEVGSRQAQAAVGQPHPRSPARTTQRGVEPAGADAEEADEALYCVCRTPYDPSFFYIGCEECHGWFHGKCVGVAAKQASSIKHFVCAACTAATGKLTTYKGVHPPCRRKPLAPGMRMEVACCAADHEGEWEGEWEECVVVADHGETVRRAHRRGRRGVPRRAAAAGAGSDRGRGADCGGAEGGAAGAGAGGPAPFSAAAVSPAGARAQAVGGTAARGGAGAEAAAEGGGARGGGDRHVGGVRQVQEVAAQPEQWRRRARAVVVRAQRGQALRLVQRSPGAVGRGRGGARRRQQQQRRRQQRRRR